MRIFSCYNPAQGKMETVLVLNANFQPINLCSTHRAVGLIVLDKASLVLNGRGIIRTVNNEYPKPSVIRLEYMVHCPRPQVHLTRKEVFRRDNYTCQYCGKQSAELTIDHVIPKHMGGTQNWENIVTACARCNHLKGGRTLETTNMHLLREPQAPPASAMYIFGKHLPQNIEWEPYLTGW